MDKLFLKFVTSSDFVKELSEKIWSYKSKTIINAIKIGADAIIIGDDYASRIDPMMSPEHFKEFILPYLKKAVEIIHLNGSYLLKHTDGNIWKIIKDIINTRD